MHGKHVLLMPTAVHPLLQPLRPTTCCYYLPTNCSSSMHGGYDMLLSVVVAYQLWQPTTAAPTAAGHY
jgi:hypothetical protein